MRRINRLIDLLRLIVTISSLSKASSFSIPRTSVPRKYACTDSRYLRQAALSPTTEEPASKEELLNGDTTLTKQVSRRSRLRNLLWRYSSLPRKPIKLYYNYVRQLWYETSTDARKRIAQDKAAEAIRAVEKLVKDDEYVEFSYETSVARERLLDACKAMLTEMKKAQEAANDEVASTNDVAIITSNEAVKPERKRRSILFGATMGFCVACWVFSGNYIFTGIFTLMTILGQLEYYRMIINTGVYPARKISVVGASSMFLTVSRCRSLWPILPPASPNCRLTSFELIPGSFCTSAASNMPSNVWFMGHDLVSNNAKEGHFYSRDRSNIHRHVLSWICSILLGQNATLRYDERTHSFGSCHWTDA